MDQKFWKKRWYNNLPGESFLKNLKSGLRNDDIFSQFNNEFKERSNHHAPIEINFLETQNRTSIRLLEGTLRNCWHCPSLQKKTWKTKLFIDQLVCYQSFQKYIKEVLYEQIENVVNEIFSSKLCRFSKGLSSQNAVLNLTKNCQKYWDTSEVLGTIAMKLSKAYGCFSYNLFVKVAAYGFEKMSLDLITDHLTNHLQRVKIGLINSRTNFTFNLFINDLTFFIKDIEVWNSADDKTRYSCSLKYEGVNRKIYRDVYWFKLV